MSDSSNLSELEEPLSSDSLDTVIGLSTKTGRTTVVTPSSSSEDQALSDPTLASSDSSRPITPGQEGNGRLQNGHSNSVPVAGPSSGDQVEHPAAAAASRSAAGRPTRGKAPGPSQPVDLLLILKQMQQQQLQQQQQMLAALMQQLQAPGARPRPGHRDMVSPPPLHSTQPARPSLQDRDPPWAARRPPRALDICRQCEDQEAHICLHSSFRPKWWLTREPATL